MDEESAAEAAKFKIYLEDLFRWMVDADQNLKNSAADKSRRSRWIGAGLVLGCLVIAVASAMLAVVAFESSRDELVSSLAIEGSSALAFFAILFIALRFMESYRIISISLLAALSVACLIAAFQVTEVARSFAIEAAVGFASIALLELLISSLLTVARERAASLDKQAAEIAKQAKTLPSAVALLALSKMFEPSASRPAAPPSPS